MTPVREAVVSLLPDVRGVFLRCDRGNCLYVSNVPALTSENIDWASAGFSCRMEGKLVFLFPKEKWVDSLCQWIRPQVREGRLTNALANASFEEIEEEDMAIFVEGIKNLEMKANMHEYEKRIRQRAAVCLREKRGGGTLRCCAMMIDYFSEGGNANED